MKNLLLPYSCKYIGLLLTVCGFIMSVLYLWFDFRFSMPVFAVFSSFIETKMFVTFRTNFADEMTLLLLISGFGMIVFSKEKIESENLIFLRAKALTRAFLVNIILLLLSILFVYGSGFLGMLVINLFSLPVIYLIFFFLSKSKNVER